MAEPPPVLDFDLPVDEENKATVIKIFSFRRPHMRAFHFAWFSFFLAFFGWFAIPPMLTTIIVSLGMCANGTWRDFSDGEKCICDGPCRAKIAEMNGVGVAGTVMMRLLVGGWTEAYGPRFSQALLLAVFSIPLALTGVVQSPNGLVALRFFIGGMGATFVVTQYWTSVMFSRNVVGTANATTAGWGNLGNGAANALMPALLFGLEQSMDSDTAWRVAPLIPAGALLLIAVLLYTSSDDLPLGNYDFLQTRGQLYANSGGTHMFLDTMKDPRVWILFVVYGGCFGTELVMAGQLASYFEFYFGLSRELAGLSASLFGLMNIFARSLGGIASDLANVRYGHRGRHWVFFVTQFFIGVALILFSLVPRNMIGLGIFVLVLFSSCVQMAEGAQFAIVPYVGKLLKALGPVSGIVGAGGNVGAVMWSFLIHRQLADHPDLSLPYRVHGAVAIGTSLLIPFLHYPALGSMFKQQTDFTRGPPEGRQRIELDGAQEPEDGHTTASSALSRPRLHRGASRGSSSQAAPTSTGK